MFLLRNKKINFWYALLTKVLMYSSSQTFYKQNLIFLLVTVAERADLSLTWSKTLKTIYESIMSVRAGSKKHHQDHCFGE